MEVALEREPRLPRWSARASASWFHRAERTQLSRLRAQAHSPPVVDNATLTLGFVSCTSGRVVRGGGHVAIPGGGCVRSGVGKTCLLLRYANDSFSPTFITTIGIDFKIKNIELDSKRIKLQIWDTAGQERFRTITTSYFRGAQGILLVYDVTDRGSFNSIRNWVNQIQSHADVHVNKILIGNKCDMDDRRVVSFEEGQKLAQEYNIQFFETSAKNNIQVDSGFVTIAREVKNRLISEGAPAVRSGNHGLPSGHKPAGRKSSSCC